MAKGKRKKVTLLSSDEITRILRVFKTALVEFGRNFLPCLYAIMIVEWILNIEVNLM